MTRQDLLRAFETRLTHPVSARELIQVLQVPREERVGVRRQLRALADEGSLVQVRGHRFTLPGSLDRVVGRVRVHEDGYGFVVAEPAGTDEGDIYVASDNLHDAMHGDRVVVRIEHRRRDRRSEGRIVRVLERVNQRVVGRLERAATGPSRLLPLDRRVWSDIAIPDGETLGARDGDMVVGEIVRWPTATRGPAGRVVEVLGRPDDPGVDTTVVIRKYGIPDAHGADAVAEAASFGGAVDARDLSGRTDFRAWPVVTIDGEDARDFDDGISIDRLPNGHYWLGVHIADVSHYVAEGGAVDLEALDRGTSVYFPDRAVHMLPEALAAGLCSLRPGADRLVQSCLMEIDREGAIVRHEFHDGVIHSAARLTYTEVNAVLEGSDADARERLAPLVPLLARMREAFDLVHARRAARGAIDFDLPQPEIVLDANGLVESIIPAERNVAHRIVEEFMLLANETVATAMDRQEYPSLYRVHDAPDPFKVGEFAAFVSSLGFPFSPPPTGATPRDFQQLILRIAGTPEEKPIAFLMLRTMQLARYEPVNRGHFGLALDTYTHFTSPIRRYPDLVVHRQLRRARQGVAAPRIAAADDMARVARQSSERERRAMEAERELVQWKKARFMAGKVGEEFDGVVTGVAAFGLFVELVEHFVEGLVHISTLVDDDYRFDDTAHELRGRSARSSFRLGDRVRVALLRVDLDRRKVELGIVGVLARVAREGRKAGKAGKRVTRARGRAGARRPADARHSGGRVRRSSRRRR